MLKEIKDILNKQLLRHKPTSEQFSDFTEALRNLTDSIQPNETEEHNKDYVKEFLRAAFYGKTNLVNTAGYIDCAIYQTKEANSPIEVIIEAKAPTNKSEFPSIHNLNCRAMQELVLYFMRQRFKENNISLKHLIMTNGNEWFIIDATEFEKHFADDTKFVKLYNEFDRNELLFSGTRDFYTEIAKPKIDKVKQDINFSYIDIRTLKSDTAKLRFYRIMQPAHLLKSITFTDTNKLNTAFYNELLYIIGLEEHKVDGKNVIERKPQGQRNTYSLLESTIYQLIDYGITDEKEQFDLALNLVITWINRILFLKLLESQLISYHGQKSADEYRFLSPERIRDFDELNELFFKVLAIPTQNRPEQVREKFKNIPYLNSSLFELTENEDRYIRITGLKSGSMIFYSRTVLKYANGHSMKMEMSTLEYLFRFLDAYDFGSEQSNDITQAESKTLINASVLGLIFEKINGYKDGSFFTPAFITQYMCQEAIERTVIQKFNDHFGWHCQTITDIHNQDFDKGEAIALLDSITLCDPAVGSGHFLVSALNRLIAIRYELGLLQDENGKRLKDYNVTIDNDELIVTDEDGEIFHYNPNNTESQRVQKTLFDLKRHIIENNLFGSDINPNSVNICRLRLWIELLKNAYYKEETHELETLPNIDINIKCGDSLKNQYPVLVGESINDKFLQKYVSAYKQAVTEYKQTSDKAKKQTIKCSIDALKFRVQHPDVQTELFAAAPIQTETQYKHSLEWMIEYPEILNDEGKFIGFDIVIGNPPYIQLQADDGKLAKLYAPAINKKTKQDSRNNYFTYARTGDIYCLFYERGYQLLKPNGILCFITSNKWMRAAYGESTRQFLATRTDPLLLIDFAGLKLFENATVDTNILLFKKDENRRHTICSVAKIKDKDVINELSDFVQSNHSFSAFVSGESWVILSDIEERIKSKIEAIGSQLKDWDIQINYGIKTGFNEAYIINEEQRNAILANCRTEDERQRSEIIIRPILRGDTINAYQIDWDGQYIINFHNGYINRNGEAIPALNPDDYPAIKDHIDTIAQEVALGQRSTKGGHKGSNKGFYERTDCGNTSYNLRPCKYVDNFYGTKIIWKQTSSHQTFVLDEAGFFLDVSGQFIYSSTLTKNALLCLLAILNSKLSKYWFKSFAIKFGSEGVRWIPSIIETFYVPHIEDPILVELAEKCLHKYSLELAEQIDAVVYKTYGLEDEEIAFIEKMIKPID